METALSIVVCVLILTLIVVGEIYLDMDKQKTRAIFLVKRMKDDMDEWIKATEELAGGRESGAETAEELRVLGLDYANCRKYKDILKRVSLVNEMAALSEQLAVDASGPEAGRLLDARIDAAGNMEPLRTEYNRCAKKINGRLDKGISAAVGRLFRVQKLEELRDLS
jgi:hypothetical protein